MAEIRRIVPNAPLSSFQQAAPTGGTAFWVLADVMGQAYDMMLPAAEAEMTAEGAALGREMARQQMGNPSAAFTISTLGGGGPSASVDGVDFAATEAQYGLPAGYLGRTAQIESGGDPNAQNPNSSAGGLFQFIDSTAADYGLANKFDAGASTDAAARLASDNAATLRNSLGREPTAGELYLAHQQGGGGAVALLSNPGARAADVVGAEAVALNGGSADMTAGEFAGLWTGKFGQGGTATLSTSGPSTPPPTMIREADGKLTARLYSPLSGPMLQVANAAAGVAYRGEAEMRASADLLNLSNQFVLNPEGFGQAAQAYVDQMVDAAPEPFREDLRSTLSQEAQQFFLGKVEEKQRDTLTRAENSNMAVIEKYGAELAGAHLSGNVDRIAAADARLQEVLRVRETLPGASWTPAQSDNAIRKARENAVAERARVQKAEADKTEGTLRVIRDAAKEGMTAAGEAILSNPLVRSMFPELVAEAETHVGLRDFLPSFMGAPQAERDAAVAGLGNPSTQAEIDVAKALREKNEIVTKAFEDNGITAAERFLPQKPPPLPDFTGDEADVIAGLQARKAYAEGLVSGGYTPHTDYISDAEKASLSIALGKSTPPEIRAAMAGAIVSGFGPQAGEFLKQVGGDPVITYAGMMWSKVGEQGREIATVAMRGAALLESKQVTAPKMPAPEYIAGALAGLPNDIMRRPELNEFAMAIYAGIVPAGELSDEDQAIWVEKAWQKALGQSEKRGQTLGGVQPIAGYDTLLPPGINGNDLDAAIGDTLGREIGFLGRLTSVGRMVAPELPDQAPWAAAGLGGTTAPMMDGKPLDRRLWDGGNIRVQPVPSAGANAYALFYVGASGTPQAITSGDTSIVYVFDPAKLIEARKKAYVRQAPAVMEPLSPQPPSAQPADPYGNAIMAPRIMDGGQ